EKVIAVEREHNALAHPAHVSHNSTLYGFNRRIDRAEDERAEQPQAFETTVENAWLQGFDVDNNVGKFGQTAATLGLEILIALQPFDDLLACPVMIVVQMKDDRVQWQALLAALGAPAAHVFQAVEEAIQPRANRPYFVRQGVCALICSAERARSPV